MFKGQYWYIILGVQLEHPGLLVRLDHVDVEGVALELLVEHREVHDDSGLDLVNKFQTLERNEPERIIKLLSTQFLCNNSSDLYTLRAVCSATIKTLWLTMVAASILTIVPPMCCNINAMRKSLTTMSKKIYKGEIKADNNQTKP